jgi:hypothetical protein
MNAEKILAKAVVVIVGLVIITFGVRWIMHTVHEYEEMHKTPTVQEGMWTQYEWPVELEGVFAAITNIVLSTENLVTMLAIYAAVILSLQQLSKGIFHHFLCGGELFSYGFVNGIQALWIMIKCGLEKMGSIVTGDCLRFYVVDMVFGLIYFIGSAILSIFWTITGVDLKPLIKMAWNITVEPLDALIFALTGHHITKWSPETYTRCYTCTADFSPNGQRKDTYHLTISQWFSVFECGFDEMAEGVYKMVTSVVPSQKWGSWIAGDHLDGSDDDPPFAL